LGQQEARAHPRRVGSEDEDGSQSSSIGHAAGRDHGDRSDRVDDGRYEWQRGYLPPDAAPCLPALRHDDADARVHGATSLLGAGDAVKMQRAAGMDRVDVWARVAPKVDTTATDSSTHTRTRSC